MLFWLGIMALAAYTLIGLEVATDRGSGGRHPGFQVLAYMLPVSHQIQNKAWLGRSYLLFQGGLLCLGICRTLMLLAIKHKLALIAAALLSGVENILRFFSFFDIGKSGRRGDFKEKNHPPSDQIHSDWGAKIKRAHGIKPWALFCCLPSLHQTAALFPSSW